jgi:hypothetical protein
MKKLVITLILTGIFSCKKKKDEATEEPTPAPTPVTPARPNVMSANINGVLWSVTGNNTSTANITLGAFNTTGPKQYVITGRTQTLSKHCIYIGFLPAAGTHSFESLGNFYAAYDDSSGNGWFANNGTINIAVVDTAHTKSAACSKFRATFSFTTNSIGSKKYIVDNGTIDFEEN